MSLRIQTSTTVADIAVDDVFINKAGDWSFTQALSPAYNEGEEIQGRFALAPMDAVVMEYLEAHVAQMGNLPVGARYDSALEREHGRMPEGEAKDVLGRDLDLRLLMVARRMEEIGV